MTLALIWWSSVFSSILKIWPTCFSKFCIQFIKMLTHSGDFNPSVKGSSLFTETSEQAELSKLPSRSFFDASPSLDLFFKSRFFYILSKYLAISILKYIQQDVNIKYNLYRIYSKIYLSYNSSRLKRVIATLPFMREKKIFQKLWKVWLLSKGLFLKRYLRILARYIICSTGQFCTMTNELLK